MKTKTKDQNFSIEIFVQFAIYELNTSLSIAFYDIKTFTFQPK